MGDEVNPNKYVTRDDIRKIIDEHLANLPQVSGVNNSFKEQIDPQLETTSAETFIKGKGNSYVVWGYDRPAGISSGNGGIGRTGASSLDLIVGLGGKRPVERVLGSVVPVQKNFKNDSARIYISQMTDLDDSKAFNIPKEIVRQKGGQLTTEKTANTSGIGIIADHVRVIGRENIKILTRHFDPEATMLDKLKFKGGVSLIAGYDVPGFSISTEYSIEPMVKGNALVKYLQSLKNNIQNVQGNLAEFIKDQHIVNTAFLNHVHQAGTSVTSAPVEVQGTIQVIINNQIKLQPDSFYNTVKLELDQQYLESSSPDYINSRWHKLN